MPNGHTTYLDKSQYSSQPHPQQEPDDYKAHYDDLIDEYAGPYPFSTAQPPPTFNVDVPVSPAHRRGLSQTLHSFASKPKDPEDIDTTNSAYPPAIPNQPKDVPPQGFWRKILPDSVACRLYLVTVLLETTVDLLIEAELAFRGGYTSDTTETTDGQAQNKMPVYLAIFAIAHVFQFVMAIDAVYARNTLQFIALSVFNALFLLYAVIQIGEIRDSIPDGVANTMFTGVSVKALTIVMPVVIAVAELAYIALGWKISNEFGWKVYKFLGADRRIKKMYANYQIFECLVKFDVFFWVGFSVQFIWLVLQDNDWEYYVTCAALPLSLLLLVEGHLAARHENKWMMITFMAGCVGASVYFVYKLVKVLVKRKTEFALVYKSLSLFSVFAIVLLVVTFVFAVIVMRNFGRGLKSSFAKQTAIKKHGHSGSQAPAGVTATAANNPNRMSID